jgi:hypothetical protein
MVGYPGFDGRGCVGVGWVRSTSESWMRSYSIWGGGEGFGVVTLGGGEARVGLSGLVSGFFGAEARNNLGEIGVGGSLTGTGSSDGAARTSCGRWGSGGQGGATFWVGKFLGSRVVAGVVVGVVRLPYSSNWEMRVATRLDVTSGLCVEGTRLVGAEGVLGRQSCSSSSASSSVSGSVGCLTWTLE